MEELVFRFLLTRGDTLGGSIRNIGGVLAQQKVIRTIIATLRIAGIPFQWQHFKTREWLDVADDDIEIALSARGLTWQNEDKARSLIFNLSIPIVGNNVDMCLFNLLPQELEATRYNSAESYIALGELKGGIDPAGADEHWKTARTALDRVRSIFQSWSFTLHVLYWRSNREKDGERNLASARKWHPNQRRQLE